MTANVSFYLIAILALRVKSHSLQERNVQGDVVNVDHHVNIYLSGFAKRYLQEFLATVSFQACSVQDRSFLTKYFQSKNLLTSCSR